MSAPVYHFALRFDTAGHTAAAVKTCFKAMFDDWLFQAERGEETGREHYQCYVHCKHKTRANQLAQEIRDLLEYNGSLYCKPASTAGKTRLKHYCMKEDTRIDGPWMAKGAPPPEYDGGDVQCVESDPFPWQKFIMDEIAKKPHPRRINCVVDEAGNMGKTTLQKYLTWKGRSIQVPIGTAAQLKTYLCNKGVGPPCYMINFNRCMGKEQTYRDVLTVCEDLKAGWIQPTMYGGGKDLLMPRPHVWIFCNEAPPTKLLSADMWCFWQYDSKTKSILKYTPVPNVPNVPEKLCKRVHSRANTSSGAPVNVHNRRTPFDSPVRKRTKYRAGESRELPVAEGQEVIEYFVVPETPPDRDAPIPSNQLALISDSDEDDY